MAPTKRRSRILEEMHETARGLHEIGLIDKRRMHEFDALCHLRISLNVVDSYSHPIYSSIARSQRTFGEQKGVMDVHDLDPGQIV